MHNRNVCVLACVMAAMMVLAGCEDRSAASNGSASRADSGAQGETRQSEIADKSSGQPRTMVSNQSFEETLGNLRGAIEARNFTIFTEIDHAAGAARIEAVLRPTTLIVFGNPRGGTPLMQAQQTMGLALPLKMLVYGAEDGKVMLAWPDMADVFHRHGLADRNAQQTKISAALSAIAKDAAGIE